MLHFLVFNKKQEGKENVHDYWLIARATARGKDSSAMLGHRLFHLFLNTND
jgi:hypothetical protein